jgi:hypothetical protein
MSGLREGNFARANRPFPAVPAISRSGIWRFRELELFERRRNRQQGRPVFCTSGAWFVMEEETAAGRYSLQGLWT